MTYRPEEVELLLQVARDATLGATLAERLEAISEPLSVLVPNTSLSAFVVSRALLAAGDDPPPAFFRNGDVASLREYADHYMQFDPCPVAGAANPGQVGTLSDVVAPARFGKDPFTGEFLPRYGVRYIMGCELPMPGGTFLSVALHRESPLGDFTKRERQTLQILGKDLARAAFGSLLRERLAQLARRADPNGGTTSGAVVFDADGDVRHADPGTLSLMTRFFGREPAALDALVLDVRRLAADEPLEGDALERRISVEGIGLLAVRASVLSTGHRPDVVCVLQWVQPAARSTTHFEEVADRAKLTRRERQIAALAVEGLGNRHIAHKLGISPVTVGVTLSRIYRKIGIGSRIELTRLMSCGSLADWNQLGGAGAP